MAICSHQKNQAQLDEILHEFSVESVNINDPKEEKAPDSPLRHFFLTAEFKKEHTFSVFHVSLIKF